MSPALFDEVMGEVLDAHRKLLASEDLSAAVPEMLEKVGGAARVDRAYIFETHADLDGTVRASQRFEWVAEGVEPELDNPALQNIALRAAGYSRWLDEFSAYRPIYGNIDEFPASEQPTLAAQGIESLLILPIFASSELWGFVGFDDCIRRRSWTEAELDLLFALTITLGQVFASDRSSLADTATTACLSLVASMLAMHAVTLTETPFENLSERTRCRLGTAVAVHRALSNRDVGVSSATVNVHELFTALQPQFDAICGCKDPDSGLNRLINLQIAPLRLTVEAAIDLTMMATEVLAVLSEGCLTIEATTKQLTVRVSEHAGRGEIEIFATGDLPVAGDQAIDGPAVFMLRHLAQRLRATRHHTEPGGAAGGKLFHASFPLRPAPAPQHA